MKNSLKGLKYIGQTLTPAQMLWVVDNEIAPYSKDESTKVGAMIVDKSNKVIMWGYNGFPRGINDNVSERQERPEKYFWMEHAERNALYNCAREGIKTIDKTVVVSFMPCMDCARGIVQSGIKKVITLSPDWNNERDLRWQEHMLRAMVLLDEAGIELHYIDKYDIEAQAEYFKQD